MHARNSIHVYQDGNSSPSCSSSKSTLLLTLLLCWGCTFTPCHPSPQFHLFVSQGKDRAKGGTRVLPGLPGRDPVSPGCLAQSLADHHDHPDPQPQLTLVSTYIRVCSKGMMMWRASSLSAWKTGERAGRGGGRRLWGTRLVPVGEQCPTRPRGVGKGPEPALAEEEQ